MLKMIEIQRIVVSGLATDFIVSIIGLSNIFA